ncbi:hypothetical protein AB0893_13915 [Micromonospora aurantiaca]|uniref:hypothetical protein n=1 Tax=Micromonospora aurantiaca (nom. illeg.) TaxID=47850 RepID=UPI003455025D
MLEADPNDLLSLPPDDVPFEGVPEFLEPSLRDWIREALHDAVDTRYSREDSHRFAELLALRLRIAPRTASLGLTPHQTALVFVGRQELLRVSNAILRFAPEVNRRYRLAQRLAGLLQAAGSAYEVSGDLEPQLVQRLDPSVRDAVQRGQEEALPTAGEHLRLAWIAAYGLEPDANVAYAEAVRAVEAVACPLVVPNAGRPTLGSVLTALRGDLQAADPKLAACDPRSGWLACRGWGSSRDA